MDIIHALSMAGIEQILLVGDPDQSIYEWNKAEPSLLIELRQAWNPDQLELSENWRSSQHICDFTFRLSSLPAAATATNAAVSAFASLPIVIGYDDANIAQLGVAYLDLLNTHLGNGGWKSNEVAILVRSATLLRTLAEEGNVTDESPWTSPHTERLCRTRVLVEAGEMKRAFAQAEKVVAGVLRGEANPSHDLVAEVAASHGLLKWRELVASVMLSLPKSSLGLGEWIEKAQTVLKSRFRDKAPTLKVKQACKQIAMKAFYAKERKCETAQGIPVRTIHAVKGATLDSVMVVLKTKGTGRTYKKLLEENVSLTDDEELRIAYVGLTRPQRLVVLAVPNADVALWKQKFGLVEGEA
jgi:superfamily I DNA/RNA helicase